MSAGAAWDMFDMVTVQDWTGYRTRQGALCAELARVGLLGRARWFWQTASPFCLRLGNALRYDVRGPRFGGFDCTMGHYRILRTALAEGAETLLVVEDDVCFCSDTGLAAAALRTLPAGWDFIKLDWWLRGCDEAAQAAFRGAARAGGGAWIPLDRRSLPAKGAVACGAGAIGYSRRGMQWKAGLLERAASEDGLDGAARYIAGNIDGYDRPELAGEVNAYCAAPCLAVQRAHGRGDPCINAARKNYAPWQLVGGSTENYG